MQIFARYAWSRMIEWCREEKFRWRNNFPLNQFGHRLHRICLVLCLSSGSNKTEFPESSTVENTCTAHVANWSSGSNWTLLCVSNDCVTKTKNLKSIEVLVLVIWLVASIDHVVLNLCQPRRLSFNRFIGCLLIFQPANIAPKRARNRLEITVCRQAPLRLVVAENENESNAQWFCLEIARAFWIHQSTLRLA